ncbi:MAG: hypothetical protein ACI9H6_000758 [Patiriisocius sp.]|jgi:hypothetical protein
MWDDVRTFVKEKESTHELMKLSQPKKSDLAIAKRKNNNTTNTIRSGFA